ncbi:unnamed protein product, partial [marine sediment metagenome]
GVRQNFIQLITRDEIGYGSHASNLLLGGFKFIQS